MAPLACLGLAVLATVPAVAASDYQWTFQQNGFADYRLVAAPSSPSVYSGALPADDPTLNLIVGKRYGVTVSNSGLHPFQVIAKGAGAAQDVTLLAQGGAGSLEGDGTINWVENGDLAEFTVTAALVAAMREGGRAPGYRCGVHASDMRGNFAIFGEGMAIADPLPAIAKGTTVVELVSVATGLVSPLGATQPDDGSGRLFVHDQVGKVWIVRQGQAPVLFLDVSARLVALNGGYDERGLLGLALSPNFATTKKVYTYTSEPVAGAADFTSTAATHDHQAVIAEWTVSAGNPDQADVATRREVLRIDKPQSNHNGGTLQFGPDGMLYIGMGDGGAADDQGAGHVADGNAQDLTNIYGTVLRIDPTGSNSANGDYGIPADNPFVGQTGGAGALDEIWAYGFRNPYAFHFDPNGGALYLGDAGQNHIEEVDVVTKGGNYGWRLKEGSFWFDPNGASSGFVTSAPVAPPAAGLIDPVAEYDHGDGSVVVGGTVYRAAGIPGLGGKYVFGEFGTQFDAPSGRLFYLDSGDVVKEFVIGNPERPLGLWIKGFGQDRAGEIYVLGSKALGPTGTTGEVLRLVDPSTVPVELSSFSVD